MRSDSPAKRRACQRRKLFGTARQPRIRPAGQLIVEFALLEETELRQALIEPPRWPEEAVEQISSPCRARGSRAGGLEQRIDQWPIGQAKKRVQLDRLM